MNSTFRVIWDGDVPGLSEHRISVGNFSEAIQLLLKAYRRIASNMLRDAVEGAGLADKRLRKHAAWLDIQIESIAESSAGFTAVGVLHVPAGEQPMLFEDLSARAGLELLSAIEDESQGKLRSGAVRKYLASLPPGIRRQQYDFESNGHQKTVELGNLELPEAPSEVPHLTELMGFVVSVGFEPGTPFVRIDTGEGRPTQCQATAVQVDSALDYRDKKVVALVVKNQAARLLHLRGADEAVEPLKAEEQEEVLYTKWDSLLHRLAQ